MKARRTVKKVLAMVFAAAMFFTSLGSPLVEWIGGGTAQAAGVHESESTNGKNALHFYVKHWHTVAPEEEEIEGYIEHADGGGYQIFVRKGKGNKYESLTPVNIGSSDCHVSAVDLVNGSITFNVAPSVDSKGKALESFSGFSVSAGHEAVSYDENALILTITYDPNIHLVKSQIFYRNESMYVAGQPDDTVAGSSNLFVGANPEQDTELVYAYPDGTVQHGGREDGKNIGGTAIRSDDKYFLASDSNGEEKAKKYIEEQLQKTESGEYITIDGVDLSAYSSTGTGGGYMGCNFP